MIIATLIISCLILIAVSIGLFLNYKSNLKTISTITSFEEGISTNIEDLKNEVLLKIKELHTNVHAAVEISKAEIQTTVKDNSKFIHEELVTKLKYYGLKTHRLNRGLKVHLVASPFFNFVYYASFKKVCRS
jgi:hypothetical protein